MASDLIASKLDGDEPEPLEIIKCDKENLGEFLASQKNIDSRVLSALYIIEKF